jgi:hypothetical protein
MTSLRSAHRCDLLVSFCVLLMFILARRHPRLTSTLTTLTLTTSRQSLCSIMTKSTSPEPVRKRRRVDSCDADAKAEYGPEWRDWPAPATQVTMARRFILDAWVIGACHVLIAVLRPSTESSLCLTRTRTAFLVRGGAVVSDLSSRHYALQSLVASGPPIRADQRASSRQGQQRT